MSPQVIGPLVALALIDSMSLGTMVIPVWFLITPGRVRVARILIFVFVVAAAYFALGLGLMFSASAVIDRYGELLESDQVHIAQFIIGLGLIVVGVVLWRRDVSEHDRSDRSSGEVDLTGDPEAEANSGRLLRWRDQAMGEGPMTRSIATVLTVLALSAVAVEIASMLPYLAAVGIVTTDGPSWPGNVLVLLGYCVIMVLPALGLTAARVAAHDTLEGVLSRIDGWVSQHAPIATMWVLGVIGTYVAVAAVIELGWAG